MQKDLADYPLLDALIARRSRQFGRGFHLDGGPLTYRSALQPQPLTLAEEAALAFAACGITGFTLGELPFESGSAPEFPAISGPFRTVLAYQAHRLDLAFYDRFYRPDVVVEAEGGRLRR